MVTTFYPPYSFGGDGIYVYRLSNELARQGHQVDIIHCRDSYRLFRKGNPTERFPNDTGVKVFGLQSPLGFLSLLLTQQTGISRSGGEAIRCIIERKDYDVIHYHNMSLMGINALAYGRAVKLYTAHEFWLVCPMHILWKFGRKPCERKNCVACMVAGKRPPQLWRYLPLFEKMLRHVDVFITPSRFARERHRQMGFSRPMTVLPLFYSDPAFSETGKRKSWAFSGNRPFFLFAGRLEKIKGLQNLIPVFKKNPDHRLVIVGRGGYESILRRMADNAADIHFTGEVPFDKLQELYGKATAVVVPSICDEVSPMVIYESFAAKTPVIVNHTGGMPEMVRESGGGIVYESEEELLDAMRRLADDPQKRDDMGKRGHEAYLRSWTAERHLEKYFRLIKSVRMRKRCLSGNSPY